MGAGRVMGAAWCMGARAWGASFECRGRKRKGRGREGKTGQRAHATGGEKVLPEHTLCAPAVPQLSYNCLNALVVDAADVKNRLIVGALEHLVPLSTNLGLVMEEDSVPISLQSRGMALKVEEELHEHEDVLVRPAPLHHVMEQATLGYQYLVPCQVFIWDYLAGWFVQGHGFQQEGIIGLGESESVLGNGVVESYCFRATLQDEIIQFDVFTLIQLVDGEVRGAELHGVLHQLVGNKVLYLWALLLFLPLLCLFFSPQLLQLMLLVRRHCTPRS
jgi:hypothetical protein